MIAVLLELTVQTDSRTYFPKEFLEQYGYEFQWDRQLNNYQSFKSTARHSTNGSKILFMARFSESDVGKDMLYPGGRLLRDRIAGTNSGRITREQYFAIEYMPASTDHWSVKMLSGLPAGTDSASLHEKGNIGTLMWNRFEVAQVDYEDKYLFDENRFGYFEERDRSTEKNMVEAASRIFFARIVGRRMETAPKRRVGSSDVKAFKNGRSQNDHVDVKEWAQARGWQWTKNDDTRIGKLTRGNRTITVPLASAYILVDDQWVEMSDVVAEKEDRWLIPLDEIEAAHRG